MDTNENNAIYMHSFSSPVFNHKENLWSGIDNNVHELMFLATNKLPFSFYAENDDNKHYNGLHVGDYCFKYS